MSKPHIHLFTDGACSGNPGPGGWAYILRDPATGKEKEACGYSPDTTNNRMELLAVIRGLQALKKPCRVDVHTDSQYVQKGMTQWLEGWKEKDFRLQGGGYRPNHDLWRVLDDMAATHDIVWYWVKGHAGHVENERADALARQGVDAVRVRFSQP